MNKKIKINFVLSVFIISILILSIFFGILCYFNSKYDRKLINLKLDKIENAYINNESITSSETLILIIDRTGAYCVKNGENYFDSKVIAKLINKSITFATGYEEEYYYLTKNIDEGELLIAIDVSTNKEISKQRNLNLLYCLLALLFVITIFAFILSGKVYEPVNQVLYRQRKFISDAGHELKTPVTIISAYSDILSKQQNSKYISGIKNQTERLTFLINDMLTLAKLDEDKFKTIKENFSLSDAVKESTLPFEEVAFENGKTIFYDIQENLEYFGDRNALIKILEILVDNAVKYSSEKGEIKITLKNELSMNTITIFNTGCEINAEDKDKIFERFYRGENSRSRNSGGSGLGLAIAKSYCKLNNWKIFSIPMLHKSMTIVLKLN